MNAARMTNIEERMARTLPDVPENIQKRLLDAFQLNEYFRQLGEKQDSRVHDVMNPVGHHIPKTDSAK